MRFLAISDKVEDVLYGPGCRLKYSHVDFAVSCGDLPYYYVEYVLTSLDKPLFYVRGNHANKVEYSKSGNRTEPRGAIDLHGRHRKHKELLLAGIQGSLRYNQGDYQYTQSDMYSFVFALAPGFLMNRIRHGRYLDMFVSHAPPFGIHDKPDPAHVGARAFRWLIRTFKPRLHLHGHIHRYHPEDPVRTWVGSTQVVNVYGHQEIDIPAFERKQERPAAVVGLNS